MFQFSESQVSRALCPGPRRGDSERRSGVPTQAWRAGADQHQRQPGGLRDSLLAEPWGEGDSPGRGEMRRQEDPRGRGGEETGSRALCQVASVVSDSATPWTVARKTPLSMGFSRQECWSGLPCPPPGDLPNPGIEPASLTSLALAGGFFNTTWAELYS